MINQKYPLLTDGEYLYFIGKKLISKTLKKKLDNDIKIEPKPVPPKKEEEEKQPELLLEKPVPS